MFQALPLTQLVGLNQIAAKMNYSLLLLIMLINPNIEEVENYLGKNINAIKKDIFLVPSNAVSGSYRTYMNGLDKNQVYFLKKKCRTVFVGTDKNDIITSVLLATEKKIDRDFFLLLVEKYGEPSQMLKMGKIKEKRESVREDYTATTVIGDVVDCSFEDEPVFIIWEKLNYRIHIKMDSIRDTSLLSFEIKK